MRDLSQSARGHLAMLLFSLSIAGSFSLGGLVANEIAPAAINSIRFLIAVAVLAAVTQALGPGIRRAHLAAPWRFLVLGGIFAFYFVMMFEGLKTASPVATSTIFTLTPLMTAGFSYLLLRQVMTGRMALALAIGAAGALWVIFRGEPAALLAFEVGRGEAVFFLGCFGHALFTPLLKRLNRGEPALVSTTLILGGCFLAFTAWGWGDIRATDWAALPPLVWVTIVYLALAASALTTLLLQYASLRLPSAKVMAYTYLTPSWVVGWELALGNAGPSAGALPGIGLTVLALVLLLKQDTPQMTVAAQSPRARAE